jgi:sugar lactone lactonase YvrE
MAYRLLHTFGGKGNGPGQWASTLRGLAIDTRGRLLAAGGSHVQTSQAESGAPVSRWSTETPVLCVASDAKGRIVTGHAGRVDFHDPAGRRLDSWQDPDRLGQVTAIAVHRDSVFFADSAARLIRRYSTGGKWLNDIGGENPTRGFLIPNGVLSCAVDTHGVLHAANPGKHRVERYSPEGVLLSKVGRFDQLDPAGFPGCCNPTTFALDNAGNLFLTEKAPPRAKVLDPNGKLLSVIATSQLDPLAKNCPIAVDSRGRVFLADPVRLLIHIFEAAL